MSESPDWHRGFFIAINAHRSVRIRAMQDLAETYRTTSNDDLIRLHADISNLTPEAREALRTEIQRRGLTDNQVAEREKQWKQEAEEDARAEREKRKKRPIRWAKIFAQLVLSIGFGIVSIIVNNGLIHLFHRTPTEAGNEHLGGIATNVIIVTFGLSMGTARGKIRATAIIGVVVVGLIAAYLLFTLAHS